MQIEKNDEQMNSELLVKIMLDSCGYVQRGVPLRNVYKIFPRYSQRLLAFGFLPCFFLNFLCRQFDVFYFQPKTIPFCKMIIMTFSKQHTSCIWTAQFFFSSIAHQKFKITSSKWQKIESDRALTRSFLWRRKFLHIAMSQNEVSFFALQSDILGAKKDTSPWDISKLNSGQKSADIHSIYNIYPWDIQLMISREQVETPFPIV